MRGYFLKPTMFKFASGLERGRKRAGGAVSLTGVSRRSAQRGTAAGSDLLSRRSVTLLCPRRANLRVGRGRRHARFHAQFRLHRARHSDGLHAYRSSEGSRARQAVADGRPVFLGQPTECEGRE